MSLSPQFLDELRSRTTLSTLIARSVKLQKAGREFKACCPFHNEKSPSFYVNDDKGFYHCFGCGAHGDAIRFLTEAKGLSFIDAVKELADSAGMEVPAPDPRAAQRNEQEAGLYDVMTVAAAWFEEQLAGIEGADARAYLDRRGISPEVAKAFGIGFAPDSRRRLKSALNALGEGKLVETGLLIRVDDKEPYDRFRGRVMIPIRDARGRTIAFGGRLIDNGEPKYLNSPETALFDKGRTLFNIDKAGPASRKTNRVIVVEGYMDVIALSKVGINEAVAPLGTALTEQQMERLWRLVDAPILFFDGDSAGQKAAIRAAERALPLLPAGKTLRFASLPAGKDPDDLVTDSGRAGVEHILSTPLPMDRLLYASRVRAIDTSNPEARAGLRRGLDDLAGSCSDRFLQEEYRRSFTAQFFEEFGWKGKDRNAVGRSILSTGPRQNGWIYRSLARSILYGFFRIPKLIRPAAHELFAITLDDDQLKRWRETIVNAVIDRPDIEYDGVKSILSADEISASNATEIKQDFRIPWKIEQLSLSDKLHLWLKYLIANQALVAELERLDRAAMEDPNFTQYDAIEGMRRDVRAKLQALREQEFLSSSAEPDVPAAI